MSLAAGPRAWLCDWVRHDRLPRPDTSDQGLALVASARAEGLAGRLAAAVHEAPDGWPQTVRTQLRELQRLLLVRGIRQLDLVRRVATLLEHDGLRVLPLKGAALAETHYDSVAERPMNDVDLLVLDRWNEAVRILLAAGFTLQDHGDHAWALRDPITEEIVELHHSVTSCPGFFPFDAAGVWNRSRLGTGQVPRLPSPEDLLVQLSLHGVFQHGLALSLVQYLDFRRVLERTPPDLDRLLVAARKARADAVLAVALEAAEVAVGASAASLRKRLAAAVPRAIEGRLKGAFASGASPRESFGDSLATTRWHLAKGRRLELLWRTLAPQLPGEEKPATSVLGITRRAGTLVRRWGRRLLPL